VIARLIPATATAAPAVIAAAAIFWGGAPHDAEAATRRARTVAERTIAEFTGLPGRNGSAARSRRAGVGSDQMAWPITWAMPRRSRISFSNIGNVSAWGPSLSALVGSGWTSTITPSTPVAIAARAIGVTPFA
jgi:hypothetical protein